MKKFFMFMCSAFCILSITLPCVALASPAEELLDNNLEEQADQPTGKNARHKEFHLAFVTADFGLQMVSMDAGPPISTMLLYLSGTGGNIIKDAQVITTIIDQQGSQQSSRALPYKGGYMIAIHHLPIGQYRVEAEVVTDCQLLTEEFRFNKA